METIPPKNQSEVQPIPPSTSGNMNIKHENRLMRDKAKQCCDRCYPLILFGIALVTIATFYSFNSTSVLETSSMALIYGFRKNTSGSCGGVFSKIRGQYYVKTAAHCINGADNISVYPGLPDLSKLTSEMRIPVQNFKIDKRFTYIPLEHDIGLIQLDSSVEKNKYITFEEDKWLHKKTFIYPGQICQVWGWASPNSSIGLTTNLNQIPVIITNGKGKLCKDFGIIFAKNDNDLVIEGYSGGPLVCDSTHVGIVSGFNVNCSQSFYMDIRYYDYDEILEQMN